MRPTDSNGAPVEGRLAHRRRWDQDAARLRGVIWLLIAVTILSGITGFGAARYYAHSLRREQLSACRNTLLVRKLQNIANEKTQRFLDIAERARLSSAAHEQGTARADDLRAAHEYRDLAASYRQLPLHDC